MESIGEDDGVAGEPPGRRLFATARFRVFLTERIKRIGLN
jgi:hypothetical protein